MGTKKVGKWAVEKDGTLKELEQTLVVGTEGHRLEVEAKFRAKKNQTTITREEPEPETRLVRPGLVLLRLATDKGDLVIEF